MVYTISDDVDVLQSEFVASMHELYVLDPGENSIRFGVPIAV